MGLEIRQLYGRVKGNFSVIHHVQQFGNEFRETDEALDLVATIGRGFSDYINCTFSDRIVTKLVTIFLGWPPGLPFQGFQLHPISKSPLAGEQAFTLYVAVNHDDCRRIVVKVADNNGHGFKPCQFTSALASVSRNQLIPALLTGTGDGGDEYAILSDAVGGVKHTFIVHDFERMMLERV